MNNILYIRRAIVNERCRWKWRTTSTLHHPHTIARLFCIANVNGRMVYKNSWAILDISGRFSLQFLALFLLDFSFIQFPRPPSFHPMPSSLSLPLTRLVLRFSNHRLSFMPFLLLKFTLNAKNVSSNSPISPKQQKNNRYNKTLLPAQTHSRFGLQFQREN